MPGPGISFASSFIELLRIRISGRQLVPKKAKFGTLTPDLLKLFCFENGMRELFNFFIVLFDRFSKRPGHFSIISS